MNSSFRNADLRFTNLLSTNFENADLRGADLTDANAIDANFAGADLRGANLTNLDLTGAHFKDAVIDETTIFCKTVMPGGTLRHSIHGLCPSQPTFEFNPFNIFLGPQ